MENKRLFSVTGIFNTPNDIIHAAEKVSEEGYKNYDVNTPYPIHGMDKAMKLKPSTLGYFALVLGLSGTSIALLFMYFTMAVDYPLTIGGKPLFALPAFIPVTFEVTVLMASLGTVASLIIVFFKFPNNAHPLQETDYMRKVSKDKYGISIEATDSMFDLEKVKDFLANIGAKDITPIYFDEAGFTAKPALFDKRFLGFLFAIAVVASATAYILLNKVSYMPPFEWMADQPRYNVESADNFFADGATMRVPVEGTVARGSMPYLYPDSVELAEKYMVNPLPMDKKTIKKGKKYFDIFCSPCHGYFAKGNSRLNDQFPNPPSLHSKKVRNWKDGHIYHIITMGQNSMPSYARLVTPEERWAIIHYIRTLQRALNAKEEDLK